ncbi:MAG TPA: inositol monophosphatase [Candidatus Methylomirabilis sp.]|nr:inositol monophosphatase [Candidatus Methylomirabilis sp.]
MTTTGTLSSVLDEDPRLDAAVRLARASGRMALERLARAQVSWKSDESMLTDVDLTIEDVLRNELAGMFPGDAVLGEERRWPGTPADSEYVWVLDPIDGTNNFGRGIPGFAISIGILRGGMPVAGVVFDPVSDHLFAGRDDRGAWLNGRPLRLEPVALSRRSLCSIRAPYEGLVPTFVLGWLRRYRLRRLGSTALTLCYVALGALAFAHDQRASLWDIAGAVPVLLEAGGSLSTPDGAEIFPVDAGRVRDSIAFLAGDPIAHHEALLDIRAAS